jgi:hypothetical protein
VDRDHRRAAALDAGLDAAGYSVVADRDGVAILRHRWRTGGGGAMLYTSE